MRYLIILFIASSVFAFDETLPEISDNSCFNSSKNHQYLSEARSKNFPKGKIDESLHNCFDQSVRIVKTQDATTPSQKIHTGASILLNPVGAAYWLLDKIVRDGVEKTVNK